jgi:hypothetical protein
MGLPMGQANRPLPQPQYPGNQLNMMMGAVPPPPPANVRHLCGVGHQLTSRLVLFPMCDSLVECGLLGSIACWETMFTNI